MGRYGTDVVSYIIRGMALNRMLSESLTGIYNAIATSYQDHSMERILISRTSIHTLLFSNMASGYLKHVIDAILYLA